MAYLTGYFEFLEFKKKFNEKDLGRPLDITDFLSYKMYPKVFEDTFKKWVEYGFVSRIPTKNFFYGMDQNEETIIEFAPGKAIIVRLLTVGPPNAEWNTHGVFESKWSDQKYRCC